MNTKREGTKPADPERAPKGQPKSFLVEQWQPPHWRGIQSFKNRKAAEAFAKGNPATGIQRNFWFALDEICPPFFFAGCGPSGAACGG
jgi:hypothetical protein